MTATTEAPSRKNSFVETVRSLVTMFLPVIAYMVGDYLVDHWAVAKQLEQAIAPYAFSTSLLIGLAAGLAQFGWHYFKTRKISSYVLQQLAWLLAYTIIPLRLGHFVKFSPTDPIGYDSLGLVGIGLAAAYFVDFLTGSRLFMAFPRHFSPEMAHRLQEAPVRRVVSHIELALITMFSLKGLLLVFGNRLLSHAVYLAVMPFALKGLLFGFLGFVFTYPRWVRSRAEKRRATEAAAIVPAAETPAITASEPA